MLSQYSLFKNLSLNSLNLSSEEQEKFDPKSEPIEMTREKEEEK